MNAIYVCSNFVRRALSSLLIFSVVVTPSLCFASPPTPLINKPKANDYEIEISGRRDCDGILSAKCGWGGFGDGGGGISGQPPSGGGGGNEAGGGGPATPPAPVARQPECLREQLFMAEQLALISAQGKPVGQYLSLIITDPLYSGYANSAWSKYQTSVIIRETSPNTGGTTWTITMHYMYNPVTNQVAQAKLVNTFESGCTGKKTN